MNYFKLNKLNFTLHKCIIACNIKVINMLINICMEAELDLFLYYIKKTNNYLVILMTKIILTGMFLTDEMSFKE